MLSKAFRAKYLCAIARILRAILIIASGMFSNAAGGFLKTHSLEASESGTNHSAKLCAPLAGFV
jgi:hypothetical protein